MPNDELTRIDITRAGTDTTILRRSLEGWRVESPLSYPANAPAADSIVAVLAEIQLIRSDAAKPAPHHGLGERQGIAVRAWSNGSMRSSFVIGASTREETYVQLEGDETVYAVRGRCRRLFDLSLDELRDPSITDLQTSDILGASYHNEHGETTLVADPQAPGRFIEATPSIRNFDVDRASKNVEVAAHLVARGFVDAPLDRTATGLFEANTSSVQLFLRGQDEPLSIYLGAPHPSGLLHLRSSLSDQVYLVSKHLSSSLRPRAKHFERSDAEMEERRALAQQASEPAERPEYRDDGEHEGSHSHGAALPTEVPAGLMEALRARAREQRLERSSTSR